MNSKKTATTGLEIAIVGMSGKFPNTSSIPELWEKLKKGEELIQFADDELYAKRDIDEAIYKDPDHIHAYGSFKDEAYFDAAFFNYQPAEASLMDPQIRVFHEIVWAALEDAGIVPDKNNNIGLYAGANDNLVWKSYNSFLNRSPLVTDFMSSLLCDKDRLSTLISYKLNLNGPSLFIRSGCSTASVAVHTACRALLMGECDTAIAGGITISSKAMPGYKYAENMFFSSDGHTRTFDATSDGTLFTNGGAAIVLKRLEKAKKDKDHIYGIIKGSAINNDGNLKIGYSAPSIEGQLKCIKRAHKTSKIDINSIAYIEAHGTGTTLGDPIEVEALNTAFSTFTKNECYIGSVKSNMGHLGAASGISGLIKTVLALKNRQLPATLHFTTPNPKIPFEKGPFKVVSQLTNLPENSEFPLRAGVSSFGIGGTNAHIILEEYKTENTQIIALKQPLLFPFSAKSKESLQQYLEDFLKYLQNSKEDISLEDIAYTLQHGRKSFRYRIFVTAKSREELQQKIAQKIRKVSRVKPIQKMPKKIVFMFPGQGVQYIGMGKHLYETAPAFREEMDKGFKYLKELMNVDFKSILYNNTGKEKAIHVTEYTQPVLFVFQYALAKYLQSLHLNPSYLIGHSFGEYTSACISGVLSFENALKTLIKRGDVMIKLSDGRMLGVSLGEKEVTPFLNENVDIGAINTPNQCLLSGRKDAILKVMQAFEAKEIKHRLLDIPCASHSFIAEPIVDEYRAFLETVEYNKAVIPFMSNVTGEVIENNEASSADYWCEQMVNTVHFSKGIQTLDALENIVFIEIGPGNSMVRLYKQNKSATSKNTAINMMRNSFDELTPLEEESYTLEALGELWACNALKNWDHLKATAKGKKIALPTYAFKRVEYPTYIDVNKIAQAISGGTVETEYFNKVNTFFSDKEEFDVKDADESKIREELIEIWKLFFGIEEVDLEMDFFEFGGDSLKALTMIKILNERYKIKILIKVFFKNSALIDLSQEIENLIWLNDEETYDNKITI